MQGLYKKVIKGDYQPIPRGFSQDLSQLISLLIQVDPKLRPNCSQILKTQFISKRITGNLEVENSDSNLLGTIKLFKNMPIEKLPRAKYRDDLRQNLSEPPAERVSDFKKMKNKQRTRDNLKLKKQVMTGKISDYSFDSLSNIGKLGLSSEKPKRSQRFKTMLRENYDTLKLPGVTQKSKKHHLLDGLDSVQKDSYILKYLPMPNQRKRVFKRNPNVNQSYIVQM